MDCGDICPFNHLFKVKCHNLLKLDEKYERLDIVSPLNNGFFSDTYLVDLNGLKVMKYINLNIKFFNDNESMVKLEDKIESMELDLNREICNQNKASKIGISPKIYIYWKCKLQQRAVIIMEYIQGQNLKNYIAANEDYLSIYLESIRNILLLNLELGILHGDLHLDNIIVAEKLYFIDFGESKDYDGSYSDLISFTIEFILGKNDPNTRKLIKENYLDTESGWNFIFNSFKNVEDILNYLKSNT